MHQALLAGSYVSRNENPCKELQIPELAKQQRLQPRQWAKQQVAGVFHP